MMTFWENKIINTLISHYYSSAEGKSKILRLRTSIIFPNFDDADHEEKTSYLEAAESLEQKGIVKLRWEKRRKGELLGTISCNNFEALFKMTGKSYPKDEVEKIKTLLNEKITNIKNSQVVNNQTKELENLLNIFMDQFNSREIGHGFSLQIMDEFIRLLEFACDENKIKNITVRALSILLYNDSKHLEHLLDLFSPLLSRAKNIFNLQNFNFSLVALAMKRSYPEATISGKLIFEIKKSNTPLINSEGLIVNLPLESAEAISHIKPVMEKSKKTVLTIENKETFYALGSPKTNTDYDCFLYTGGYPNSAVTSLIKILVSSGFTFYHAGDLDPDGILILQNIQDIINSVLPKEKITPVKMDANTFDQYRKWARPLTKNVLRQIEKIHNETRAITDLEDLIQRIKETGLGVEQEIIDYR